MDAISTLTATATATATEPSSSSPMRQSCDRCHKQKLRCTRESSTNSGACDKCIRKRAQCIYSFALPKGRPSRYRASSVQIEGAPSSLHRPEPSQPIPVSSTSVSSVPELDRRDAASPSPSPKLVSRGQVPTFGDNSGTDEEDRAAAAPSSNALGLDLSDPNLASQDSYTGIWEWNGAASIPLHDLNWHLRIHTGTY
ncbi:hypothetical protein F4825DRAFT_68864 [Nemania diffusa]|nr:hypothetical protein F4825DRAFT_68864 [Nemania diffusa]